MNAVGTERVTPGLPRMNLAVNVNFNHFSETSLPILNKFIYTIFQEGEIFSSTASLPYGPLNI